ncbi:MAG: 3-methyl-2-oxobutanoate hydroxymethyltransferase, partial [Beijerinckiaceae bacterium]|nr:3-methyl-2-oxobutanoate hydroxymethyltransferase [Beijerinckiaceae bacterium]
IAALTSAGIPVVAHCGLRPQNVHLLGGYKVQRDAERLLREAREAESAGAFCVLLECIPAELATQITASVKVPTIGIGASAACDGQILVLEDMLGLSERVPKFVKKYGAIGDHIRGAIEAYAAEVRSRNFPAPEHTYAVAKAK